MWTFLFAMAILLITWDRKVSAIDGVINFKDVVTHNLKIRNIRIPDPVLTPIPGDGLELFLNELFLDLYFEWESLARSPELLMKVKGFATLTSKVQVSFTMLFTNERGRPSFTITSCNSLAKEFDIQLESEAVQFSLNSPDNMKSIFENLFCQEAEMILQKEINEKDINDWITLYEKVTFEDSNGTPKAKLLVSDEVTETPLIEHSVLDEVSVWDELEMDTETVVPLPYEGVTFPKTEEEAKLLVLDEVTETPLIEQSVLDEVSVTDELEMDTETVVPLPYEEVTFPKTGETTQADLTSYETLGMTFPEEVLNQALMVPYKNGLNLSFEMNVWGGLAATLLLNWIQAEGPFRMNFYSPYTPTACITRTGIYSYIEGLTEVTYNGAALKSSSSTMTFSCIMVFSAYLTSDQLEMRFKPTDLHLILRRAGFSLSGVNKVIGDHFARVFLSSLTSYFDFELPKFKKKSVVNPTIDLVPGYILFLSDVKRSATSIRKG